MLPRLAILFFLLDVSTATAGAWLREKGTGFSSITTSGTLSRDFSETTYWEYGVRDDLTLGVEAAFFTFASGAQSGSGMVFLRRPIGKRDRPSVWAYELSMGADWSGVAVRPNIRGALSWGRGYQLRQLNGWMAVDGSIKLDVYDASHTIKIDSTVGLNFNDRFSGMIQVFHANTANSTATSIAPSFVVKPIKSKPNIRLQIGGGTELGDVINTGFKISFWREF